MQRTLPLWKGLSFLYQQPFKMPKEVLGPPLHYLAAKAEVAR